MKILRQLTVLCMFGIGSTMPAQTGPTIFGRITDWSHHPIANATVAAVCVSGDRASTRTDPDGHYSLIFYGDCHVQVSAAGYVTVVKPQRRYYPTVGETVNVSLESLTPTNSETDCMAVGLGPGDCGAPLDVAFHVIDPTGRPIPDALVTFREADALNSQPQTVQGTTAADGVFSFTALRQIYDVTVKANGFMELKMAKRSVQENNTLQLQPIATHPPQQVVFCNATSSQHDDPCGQLDTTHGHGAQVILRARVMDNTGARVPGAHVKVSDDSFLFETKTDAFGDVYFKARKNGRYRTTVSASGFYPWTCLPKYRSGATTTITLTVVEQSGGGGGVNLGKWPLVNNPSKNGCKYAKP